MVRARGLEPPWRVGKALRTETGAIQTTIVPDQSIHIRNASKSVLSPETEETRAFDEMLTKYRTKIRCESFRNKLPKLGQIRPEEGDVLMGKMKLEDKAKMHEIVSLLESSGDLSGFVKARLNLAMSKISLDNKAFMMHARDYLKMQDDPPPFKRTPKPHQANRRKPCEPGR